MRIHPFVIGVAAGLGLLLIGRPASAATADLNLDCYDPAGGTLYQRYTESDSSPNLIAFGGLFSGSVDSEIQCQFVVPANYYSTSLTEPSVRLVGSARTCVSCVDTGCNPTKKVKFKVSSKALQDGYGIFLSWGTESSDEESYTSQSCSDCVTSNCYQDDQIRALTADALIDASGWAPGDVVLIRILRDTSVTNNLLSDFLVTGFRLTYPLD